MLKSRERTISSMKRNLNPVVAKVLKRLHYPLDVILLCVRWYPTRIIETSSPERM